MMHCHILQHMIMGKLDSLGVATDIANTSLGMQTVWVFGNASEITSNAPYPDVTGYFTYGGDVYGNSSYSPTMYHHSS